MESSSEEKEKRPSTSLPAISSQEPIVEVQRRRNPLHFYLAFLSLVIMVLLVSLDSTSLAVAIPVSIPFLLPSPLLEHTYSPGPV
jgi:hypothetical protein